MADRMMNADATAAFLAERDATDAQPEAKAPGKVYTPAEAAELRSGRGSSTAGSPDGKPKATAKPWRKDAAWWQALAETQAKFTKLAIDAELAPLLRRIGALESEKSPDDISLSHYSADGKLIAEYWQRANQVSLRVGGKRTSQAAAGTPAAEKLLAEFDRLA